VQRNECYKITAIDNGLFVAHGCLDYGDFFALVFPKNAALNQDFI
jgi:hypothetical protein